MENPVTPRQRERSVTTVIFDGNIGLRMSTIRMKMNLDQEGLGKLLGLSQQVISNLERGRRRHADINMNRFYAVFDVHAGYILTGAGSEKYNPGQIKQSYWDRRLANCGPNGLKITA